MKTFFFMAGLQRSGGTVLSAILNQNSAMHSAPASPLFKMYTRLANSYEEPENLDYRREDDIANIYYNIPHAFYASNESQYIVDKNYNWVSPLGVEIIQKFINSNVKIICPVRNIVDILTSYDTIINANDNSRSNPMDQKVIATSYPDKPIADRRADFLMAPNQDIYQSINYMANIWNSEHKNIMHIVDYDELTSKPQETLNSIYNFLEIKPFKHDFDNIQDTLNIPSKSIIGIYDFYKVNSKLEKKSVDSNKVLLPETIDRYSGLEFWK
jgi:sulfotransferase